ERMMAARKDATLPAIRLRGFGAWARSRRTHRGGHRDEPPFRAGQALPSCPSERGGRAALRRGGRGALRTRATRRGPPGDRGGSGPRASRAQEGRCEAMTERLGSVEQLDSGRWRVRMTLAGVGRKTIDTFDPQQEA